MRSIAIFNNKGGVGKTTLLCNLSAFLGREMKKSVLIIDADPQCNATQNMFKEDELAKLYTAKSFTINSVVKPLSTGKGYSQDLEPIENESFGVDVIPGDQRLALMEDLLATDWGHAISGNTRGLRTTFLFSHLLSKCQDYDYVFFDMGPSLGSINRAVLLAADFFLTPMSTDIFSLQAIDNISSSLSKWRKQLETGLELNEEPNELEVEDIGWKLKFVGYVTQQYIAKKDAEGTKRAVKAYDQIMRRVPKAVAKEIVDKFQPEVADINYELGSIPTLHSLIPMSQTSRRPIFALRAADGVVGAHFSKVTEYRGIIASIAKRLLQNIDSLE